MIPQHVYDLCQSRKSVTTELANNPSLTPKDAAKALFGIDIEDDVCNKTLASQNLGERDLDQARQCGNWGDSKPSDLFLKVGDLLENHRVKTRILTRQSIHSDLSRCPVHIGQEPSDWFMFAISTREQWRVSVDHHGPRARYLSTHVQHHRPRRA